MPTDSRVVVIVAMALLLPKLSWAGVQPITLTEKGHLGTMVTLGAHGEKLFVVDTAASSSAIYEHGRAALDLDPDPALQVQLQGVSGTQTIDRYHLPPLRVAGIDAGELVVAGLPSGVKHGDSVMGILGQDVLSRYVVEFDLPANRLGLHPAGTELVASTTWREVPFTLVPNVGFVNVQIEIEGKPVAAVLDTGARRSFINWKAAAASGVAPDSPQLKRSESSGGATGHAFEYQSYDFSDIYLGPTEFGASTLSIADLPVFSALGMQDKPAMILGLDLLGNRRFVIDYPRSRLLIER